jgi:hypothetical protein
VVESLQAPKENLWNTRRWTRFTLSSLLLLTTLIGVWLSVRTNRARLQRQVVAAIRQVGVAILLAVRPRQSYR